MRKIFFSIIVVISSITGFAQVEKPVKWNFTTKKISNDTYEVHLTATIQTGWHIYSQSTPDGGPTPTTISFSKNPFISPEGTIKELGKLEQHHEKLFGVDVRQFSNKVVFVQTIKLKSTVKTALKGTIEFMACNDKQCLPPGTTEFSVSIK